MFYFKLNILFVFMDSHMSYHLCHMFSNTISTSPLRMRTPQFISVTVWCGVCRVHEQSICTSKFTILMIFLRCVFGHRNFLHNFIVWLAVLLVELSEGVGIRMYWVAVFSLNFVTWKISLWLQVEICCGLFRSNRRKILGLNFRLNFSYLDQIPT